MQEDGAAASPHNDLVYGIPLEDALARFAQPALTEAVDAARRAWVQAGRPPNPSTANMVARLAGGSGIVTRPHATVAALFEAAQARCQALRAQLISGDLELHWTTDPIGGEWQCVRVAAWEYLQIGHRHSLEGEPGVPTIIWPRGIPRPKGRLWVRVRRAKRAVAENMAGAASSELHPEPSAQFEPTASCSDPPNETAKVPKVQSGASVTARGSGKDKRDAAQRTQYNWSDFDSHIKGLLDDPKLLACTVGAELTFLQYVCRYARAHTKHRKNAKKFPELQTVKKHLGTIRGDWDAVSSQALAESDAEPGELKP
jgi:hypothetical protein